MRLATKLSKSLLLPLCTATLLSLPLSAEAAPMVLDGLAATVNGKVITVSQVRQAIAVRVQVEKMGDHRYTQETFDNLIANIENEALQDLIDKELIIDEFDLRGGVIKQNFVDDSIDKFIQDRFAGDRQKFIEELRDTGMTLKAFRELREEALVVQYMRSINTNEVPPATPSERMKWLDDNGDRFRGKDYVHLRTITIPKSAGIPDTTADSQRKLTEEIQGKIKEGADFGLMAKTYSEDSKARNGGDWGTVERDDFKTLLSDAAFKLKEHTVSSILEDERNFYLLWVEAAQRGRVPPLEEIREKVARFVLQEKRIAAHQKWMQRLRDKANINIYEQFTLTP